MRIGEAEGKDRRNEEGREEREVEVGREEGMKGEAGRKEGRREAGSTEAGRREQGGTTKQARKIIHTRTDCTC